MLDMHFYSIYIFWKSPWTESDTADLAISQIKKSHNIEKNAIIEKQKTVVSL